MGNQYLLEIDGYDEALDPASTFTRATTAYKKDGSTVASGVVRREQGRFNEAVMIEGGTTNLFPTPVTLSSFAIVWAGIGAAEITDLGSNITNGVAQVYFTRTGTVGSDRRFNLPGNTMTVDKTKPYTVTLECKVLQATSSCAFYLNGAALDARPSQQYTFMGISSAGVPSVSNGCVILNNVALDNGFSRISVSIPTSFWSGSGSTCGLFIGGGWNNVGTWNFYCKRPQLEQGEFATSFMDGTRNDETLKIDTADVLSAVEGSLECWFKAPAYTFTGDLINTILAGVGWQFILLRKRITGISTYALYLRNGAAFTISADITFAPNTWVHLTWTWKNGSNYGLYVNGVCVLAGAYATGNLAFDQFLFGGNGGIAYIDDLRISSRARSADEIMALYTSNRPVKADIDTAAIYHLDQAGVRTNYFCTGTGFVDGDITYLPRVKQPGNIKTAMFQDGKTGGASSVSYGDVTLINLDGGLDYLKSYGFDGRKLTVKIADTVGVSVLFSGTMEQPVFSWDSISFRVRDKQAQLQVPLQPNKYLGNNALPAGLEGVEDIKGRPKPLLLGGTCRSISPVLVNTSKLVYQVNDGLTYSITAVRDGGCDSTLGGPTFGVNHANSAAMLAATVAAGVYDTCLAEGYIRLGSPVFYLLTCDAIQKDTAYRSAAQVAQQLVLKVLPQDDIYAQGIIAVDAANSAPVGIYVTEETTVAAVLDVIVDSIGGWYNFDGDGKWNLRLMSAPGNNPLTTLTEADILSIERLQTNDEGRGVPAWRYLLEYNKNFTIQTSGLAPAALAANIQAFTSLEYLLTAPAEDASVKTKHPLAGEMKAQSLICGPAAAATEATRRLGLYGVERERLQLKCPQTALKYPAGGWWDDNAISEMPGERGYHGEVIYGNYRYIIGGVDGDAVTLASVIRLDLTNPTGTWDDAGVTDLPAARHSFVSLVHNNYLYIIGGCYLGLEDIATASVIRLDLTNPTGAWDDAGVTDLPATRQSASGAVHNGYAYIVGGANLTGTASVIRLDLTNPTGAWDDAGVTDLPAIRRKHASALHGNFIYAVGGVVSEATSASVIRLDLANPTGAWDDAGVTDLPATRVSHMSVIQLNKLYVIGGLVTGAVSASVITLDLTNPTGAWDDASGTDLPSGRYALTVTIYSGNIFVSGGCSTVTIQSNTYLLRSNDNVLDRAKLFEIGQDIRIQLDRYDWQLGKNFKIIGSEVNYESEEIILDLWG